MLIQIFEQKHQKQNIRLKIFFQTLSFQKFAQFFSNPNGEVNTEDFIDTMIEFSVTDREINGEIYSKKAPVAKEEVKNNVNA